MASADHFRWWGERNYIYYSFHDIEKGTCVCQRYHKTLFLLKELRQKETTRQGRRYPISYRTTKLLRFFRISQLHRFCVPPLAEIMKEFRPQGLLKKSFIMNEIFYVKGLQRLYIDSLTSILIDSSFNYSLIRPRNTQLCINSLRGNTSDVMFDPADLLDNDELIDIYGVIGQSKLEFQSSYHYINECRRPQKNKKKTTQLRDGKEYSRKLNIKGVEFQALKVVNFQKFTLVFLALISVCCLAYIETDIKARNTRVNFSPILHALIKRKDFIPDKKCGRESKSQENRGCTQE